MSGANFTREEFDAVLEACRGIQAAALPLPQLQRHLIDQLKGSAPELAARVAALHGDPLLRLAEDIKARQGAGRGPLEQGES